MKPLTILIAAAGLLLFASCGTRQSVVKPSPEPTRSPAVATPEGPAPSRPAPTAKPKAAQPISFEAAYFEFDRADIQESERPLLARHAARLHDSPGLALVIEGHCDERGTPEYNLALGMRRAEAAKRFLVQTGIDPARLVTFSYGEERPADPRHGEAAWARNRRAEFRPGAGK